MYSITPHHLDNILKRESKSVVINLMRAVETYYEDQNKLKSLLKDYVYSGFKAVAKDIEVYNEGLRIVFEPKD